MNFPSLLVPVSAFVGFGLLHAAIEVEGALTLVAMTSLFLVFVGGIAWFRGGRSTIPLSQRPLKDLVCVAGFVAFSVIAVVVDLVQAGAGPGPIKESYGPSLMKDAFLQWVQDCDPLLGANPLWYWFLAVLSPLFYLPIYVIATFAFIEQNNAHWIRNILMMWASLLSCTTVLIITEELFGEYASPRPLQMLGGYAPYVIFPLFVIWRLWDPVVFRQ